MNADQYFSGRADLIARMLQKHPFSRDWRAYAVGGLCLIAALATEIWAAGTLVDPGFFARTSGFLTILLAAGVWLLTVAVGADVFIARTVLPAREAVLQQTLSQLLKTGGSLAHKLIGQNT